MDRSSWFVIWAGVPFFVIVTILSLKFARKHYSDLLNDKNMPSNKLLRVWYIQYKTVGFIVGDVKEWFRRVKLTELPYETICYSCHRQFSKEELKDPFPLWKRQGMLCPECWKKDRNIRIALFIPTIVLVGVILISLLFLKIK